MSKSKKQKLNYMQNLTETLENNDERNRKHLKQRQRTLII